MIKKFLQSSLASLGEISALAAVPVLLQGAPAQAQAIDGRLSEYEEATPTLAAGAEGSAVQDIQIFLDELGYYNGPIDGTYDDALTEAVQAYQGDYGLPSDGIVGADTWNSFLGIDADSIFESDDAFDEATGVYTDYEEDGISANEGTLDDGGISQNEDTFNNEGISGDEVLDNNEISGDEVLDDNEISGDEVLDNNEISGDEVLGNDGVSGEEGTFENEGISGEEGVFENEGISGEEGVFENEETLENEGVFENEGAF